MAIMPATGLQVGSIIMVHNVRCRVIKMRDFGTVDVEEIDGPRAWRVSGLSC
jgi:cellobiose-specific phosphotransferase system component IIB